MKRYTVNLTLIENTVISESAATAGGHRSLSYLSGANLLGVVASKLYMKLTPDEQFLVFHSGKVRFGDALPVSEDGQRGHHVPLCRSYDKGASYFESRVNRDYLTRLNMFSLDDETAQTQQVQLREGYVTDSLELIRPEIGFTMKTAINPNSGVAENGQLFGYQYICAGQEFRSYLDIDKDPLIDGSTLTGKILGCLEGELFLGRSRSAQFGATRVTVNHQPLTISGPSTNSGRLVLWCQSDLAVRNNLGQPTTDPFASLEFGELLPGWVIDTPNTFVRSRSYSPFNGKRRCYDLERQVIEAGSIISFLPPKVHDQDKVMADIAAALDVLQYGLGAYRECGLGQFEVNHPLVMEVDIGCAQGPPTGVLTTRVASPDWSEVQRPDDPVVLWMESRFQSVGHRALARELASRAAVDLNQLYNKARKYAGRPATELVGPGATQWSRVGKIGLEFRDGGEGDKQKIISALFDDASPICGHLQSRGANEKTIVDEDWSVKFGFASDSKDPSPNSFSAWLSVQLENAALQRHGLFLMQLADEARKLTIEIPTGILNQHEDVGHE